MKNTKDLIFSIIFVSFLMLPWAYSLIKQDSNILSPNFHFSHKYPSEKLWAGLTPKNITLTLKAASERISIRAPLIRFKSNLLYQLSKILYPLPFGTISSAVFYGTPNWLFWHQDFPKDCRQLKKYPEKENSLALTFIKKIEDLHPETYLIIAPDKSTIYRNKVGPILGLADCWKYRHFRNRKFSRFAKDFRSTKFINLWSLLYREKRKGRDVYLEGETHWNSYAQMLAIKKLLDELRPNILESNHIKNLGVQSLRTDLKNNALIIQGESQDTIYEIQRENIQKLNYQESRIYRLPVTLISSEARIKNLQLIEGKTLIVHDSFFNTARVAEPLSKYFKELLFIHIDSAIRNPRRFKRIAKESDRIIFQSVERKAWSRMSSLAKTL